MMTLRALRPWILLFICIVALGVGLARLPVQWAALLVAGSVALVGLLLRPPGILCLLAFAVPFGSIREVALGPLNASASEVLIVLLLAFWVAQMVAGRRIVVPHPPLLAPLLLFLAAILLSTLGATSLELAAKEIVKWVEVVVVYLFMDSAVDDRWGKWVVGALLAAGSAEAVVGVYQFLHRLGPEGFVLFERFMRAYGHFAQPNPFAGYMGLTIPLAYGLILEGPETWRIQMSRLRSSLGPALGHMLPYFAALAAAAVMGLAMAMSWSRGAWVGLAAAVAVMTVVRSRRVLAVALAVALLLAYVLLVGAARYLPAALVQRITDFLPYASGVDVRSVQVTNANFALIERMAHWLAAEGMFLDHPWLGVGIGNYPVAYATYALGRWRDPLWHAHNYYLNIAAEAGVVGLGAYVILFAACLLQAWRAVRATQGYWRAAALGALGVLVHLSVHNLFDNLFVHSMNVQLGLVLGLLSVAEKTAGVRDARRD